MKPEIKAKLAAALRSGEFEQEIGALNRGGKFCVLGVLCELHRREVHGEWREPATLVATGKTYFGKSASLPYEVSDWARLSESEWRLLIEANDQTELSFPVLADLIEAKL